MFRKLWIIFLSKIKRKDNLPDWYKQALDICNECEYNSKFLNGFTLKQKIIYWLSFKKPFCTQCLCTLADKAAMIPYGEDCGLVEKGEESKWKSIYIPNSGQQKKWK